MATETEMLEYLSCIHQLSLLRTFRVFWTPGLEVQLFSAHMKLLDFYKKKVQNNSDAIFIAEIDMLFSLATRFSEGI